jgi:hypothetical protein
MVVLTNNVVVVPPRADGLAEVMTKVNPAANADGGDIAVAIQR